MGKRVFIRTRTRTGKQTWKRIEQVDLHFPRVPPLRDAMTCAALDEYRFSIKGKELLYVDKNGSAIVRKGYASDGCSMAPDFKKVTDPCVLHDALRQAYYEDVSCPWSRLQSDQAFYVAMTRNKFGLRNVYFWAVAGPLGKLYSKLSGR